MKVFRDVYLGSASKRLRSTYLPWVLPDKDRIIEAIKGFVQETPGWKFDDCGEQENPLVGQISWTSSPISVTLAS